MFTNEGCINYTRTGEILWGVWVLTLKLTTVSKPEFKYVVLDSNSVSSSSGIANKLVYLSSTLIFKLCQM